MTLDGTLLASAKTEHIILTKGQDFEMFLSLI